MLTLPGQSYENKAFVRNQDVCTTWREGEEEAKIYVC